MSEKNNINEFDLMMKSILDEGREEVPSRVWEGVAAGLDKASGRKTVTLWFRRAAVGAAAAAAIAVGVIFNHNEEDTLVPQVSESGTIAVVDTKENDHHQDDIMIAEAPGAPEAPVKVRKDVMPATASDLMKHMEISEEEAVETPEQSAAPEQTVIQEESETQEADPVKIDDSETKDNVYFPEVWEEEDERKPRRGVSFTLSGIAGTNNSRSQNRIGPMKSPSLTLAPKETGIEETSTKSSYGIPLSFGAGVRFDLSDRWSIGTGVNYTLLTRQFHGKYTKINEAGAIKSSTSSDIRNTQHFVGVPVNIFYDIIDNRNISLYAYAGGAAEKCVADKYDVLSTTITHERETSGVQMSANIGMGVEFLLGKHLGLYIDPSLRYYFNNGQPKSIRTVQPLMLGFEMGIRARL